jgi:hypothetical protein
VLLTLSSENDHGHVFHATVGRVDDLLRLLRLSALKVASLAEHWTWTWGVSLLLGFKWPLTCLFLGLDELGEEYLLLLVELSIERLGSEVSFHSALLLQLEPGILVDHGFVRQVFFLSLSWEIILKYWVHAVNLLTKSRGLVCSDESPPLLLEHGRLGSLLTIEVFLRLFLFDSRFNDVSEGGRGVLGETTGFG